ncbi:extensin [Novosphingobium sp. PC22D]|uniref:extensin family protein n=1 Tax=Novosphingobium sp. PC22D TaxID=1962403 RepID=UPI000BF1740E|nr:extensin family protein [Novosphingobium sp. PC22D]PEQ12025.1 extensin [Novosphingobium sp. PC22D]
MRKFLIVLPLLASLGGCIDIPKVSGGGSGKRETVRQSTRVATPRPATRQCLADLDQSRAEFTPLPDRYYGGGCSTLGSVRLASLQGDMGEFTLTNLGPVTCEVASAFAGWARFGVDRAARQILGSPLARIETMGSYNCRTVAGTSRLSGHAKGNAIDVGAFVLEDGRRVSVLNDWTNGTSAERRFLRVVHDSACKRFGTTLGPNYNAAHKNHFHLEADAADFCR